MELGNFPATLQVTPDGGFVYVVNFNLHGEMVPSSVSVVSTDPMIEVARIQTCTMPHGSRLNAAGTKHYSACMMDDMLVEIDTRSWRCRGTSCSRRVSEHGRLARRTDSASGSGRAGARRRRPRHGAAEARRRLVLADVGAAVGRRQGVFVACNKANDIVEIDASAWTMKRRIPAGDGVYNLAVTRDGQAARRHEQARKSVSIIDIASGKELARIPTQRRVVHGVAISATTATRSSRSRASARSRARSR